ncbi:MAG: bifunctional nuclease family protein [Bacteroidia bacterium]|nr:bifunctional nuclease family protein [Bacteroidia bacterium]MCX7763519.1 bifunctional nuclease family protein [Bacteroidia bacterium]MDW8057475.1 bifunctional nuclease family protein [Bacteroidia bacterium]
MAKVEMEIAGLSRSPTEPYSAFVIILRERHGSRRLPIVIGFPEAHAINIELENIKHPRPLTHDLFINTLRELGVSFVEVVIDRLQDSTFFAHLVLESRDREVTVDCRPSDGIALALRARAPIYCEEEVLEKAGQLAVEEEEEKEEQPAPRPSRKTSGRLSREDLERLLEEALANEDYETAARLRDELRKLSPPEEEEPGS